MVRLSSKMKNVGKGFYGLFGPPPASVIRFTVGEPDFDTPEPIKRAAMAALEKGDTHYVDSDGRMNLREAIAAKLRADNAIPADPKDVIVTVGGKEAIFDAILTVTDVGDEVIIPSPAWPSYDAMVAIAGGRPVPIRLRMDDYHPDIEAIKAAISSTTKAIILNSPCNPTGAVFTMDEFKAIADLAVDHDLVVVSDEVYEYMVYGGRRHISIATLPGMQDRTVTVNAFSKAYAMTGWRIGYMHATGDLIGSAKLVHMHATTCAVSFGYEAALVALKECRPHLERMVKEYDRRRTMVRDGLNSIPGFNCPEPEGAFYAFVDVSGLGMPTRDLSKLLFKEANVMIIPGADFTFGEGFLRFSYATAYDKCVEGIERIKKVDLKPKS